MAKSYVTNGTRVTSAFLNAVNNPHLDGSNTDGAGTLIPDSWLSHDPSAIKSNFYNFYQQFQCSAGSGLVVNYLGGVVLLANGSPVTVSVGSLTVANNATSYIYINTSGSVTSSVTFPTDGSHPLAIAVASSGSITSVTDIRPRTAARITPTPSALTTLGRPYFRLSRNTVSSSQTGNVNAIFTTTELDSDNIVTLGTSTITVPSWGAGNWTFGASMLLSNNTGGTAGIQLVLKANNVLVQEIAYVYDVLTGTLAIAAGSVPFYRLNAGDTVN